MQLVRFISDDGNIYQGCDPENGYARVIKGAFPGKFKALDEKRKIGTFLAPLVPPAIFCIGLNYRLHAKETGLDLPKYPVVFMKNPSAAIGHQQTILLPPICMDPPEVDYEAELCVVIGKEAKNVSEETALDYVLGYSCANDVSARRWQRHAGAGQWVKSKSFDTFCPFGPWIVTADEIDDPNALEIEGVLNGETLQKSNTSDMIFTVAQIISYLSQSATLMAGSIILTGTPSGVGYTRKPPRYLKPDDMFETRIEKIGSLLNPVAAE